MKNWRKIGVGFLVLTFMSGGVLAGESYLIGPESSGTIGTHLPYPGYGGDNSFGGCNEAGTFCWSIELPPTQQPPYQVYPIEVYGEQAKNIVERGRVIDRRFSWSGWRYLVKTGWQSWFQFKNKTFDCSVSRHQPTEYFCEEWTPQDRW